MKCLHVEDGGTRRLDLVGNDGDVREGDAQSVDRVAAVARDARELCTRTEDDVDGEEVD